MCGSRLLFKTSFLVVKCHSILFQAACSTRFRKVDDPVLEYLKIALCETLCSSLCAVGSGAVL